jgi:hypothetical protein
MPKAVKIDTELLGAVLKQYDGDYTKTAQHLNVRKNYVRDRVLKDPKLRAVWVENGRSEDIPDEIDVIARESNDEKNQRMVENLEKNGRDVFENDIKSMLVNPENAEKLEVFKNFDDSIGMFMSHALNVTQKLNMRQNIALFEVGEKLREELEDPLMDPEEKALKTRLLIQACEQQGKFHDRLLKGLEFQLKLYDQKAKTETKKKPGFRPLRELKDVDEEAEGQSTS